MRDLSKKLLAASVVCCALTAGSASADLIWFTGTDSGSAIIDSSLNPLTASPDATIGDFLQLIFSPSQIFDTPVSTTLTGIPNGSDNIVVDAAFFGRNTTIFVPAIQGLMQQPKNAGTSFMGSNFMAGDTFIVRAWTEPASFFDEVSTWESTIPNTATARYGDSALFTYMALDPQDDEFRFDTEGGRNTGWQASLAVIPEPSTFALLLLSLGLGRRLRRTRG